MTDPKDAKDTKRAVVTDEDKNANAKQAAPIEEARTPLEAGEPVPDNPDSDHVPLSSGEAGTYKFVRGKRVRVTDEE